VGDTVCFILMYYDNCVLSAPNYFVVAVRSVKKWLLVNIAKEDFVETKKEVML